ncbi:MAG: insulinase family protein [Kiritimatiellae bacterium]|nr:insulinase family protein [Kiritimatiellia bacterium]
MFPEASLETLPNGLRIVFAQDDHAESVSFGLFVASGSRHEGAADAGASHFIEHMLFKGTRKRSALAISSAIEGRGGNFNAWTSEEGTCFFAYLPYDGISVAVDILCDMYLHAAIPPAEFARERRVILEEIKMYGDEPDSVASENLSKQLFPGNALGLPIAGGEKTLSKMTPAYLRRYMRRAYVPSATVAVLAGRFDTSAARRMVVSRLGRMSAMGPLVPTPVDMSSAVVPEMRETRDIQQVQLALGYRIFGALDARRHAATVFDTLMGRTMSSRLFQSVRERRGLSYDIRSQLQLFGDCGGWCVTAGLDVSRTGKALAAIDTEIDRIRQRKPSAAELRRTKDYLLGSFRLGFEHPRTRLFYFGLGVQTYGRIVPADETVERIMAVTADDVQDVAQEMLQDRNRAVSWVTPKEKT